MDDAEKWAAVQRELGLDRTYADDTQADVLERVVVAQQAEIRTLKARTNSLEKALNRLWPDWDVPGACLPDCKGACCDMG